MNYKIAQTVYAKTAGKCLYCGSILAPDENLTDHGGKIVVSIRCWDVDHFVPKAAGGTDHIDNLVPACRSCNRKKGTKSANQFLFELMAEQ